MEEKVRFVVDYERDEQTMTELCERYGIARETVPPPAMVLARILEAFSILRVI